MLVTQQPVLRRFWYALMPVSALADGPKPFTLLGERIVLFMGKEGPVALADRCCHRTAQLSKGWVEDGVIVCGYHGWRYDQSGACVCIPQQADNAPIPAGARRRVSVRSGYPPPGPQTGLPRPSPDWPNASWRNAGLPGR